MPPDARRREATTPSSAGTLCSKNFDPYVVRTPAVGSRSLMEYGMPSSGPAAPSPRARASAALASRRAASAVTVRNALSPGFSCAIRLRTASVSSTGESCRARINRLSSVAGVKQSSVPSIPDPPRAPDGLFGIEGLHEPGPDQILQERVVEQGYRWARAATAVG